MTKYFLLILSIAVLSGCPNSSSSTKPAQPTITEKGILNGKAIDHIIVVVLENRGFDHFMGWLYEGGDKDINHVPALARAPKTQANLHDFEGLDALRTECGSDKTGKCRVSPNKGARASNIPTVNPHEDFIHIFEQMYNMGHTDMGDKAKREALVKANGKYKTPSMDGWEKNYVSALAEHGGISKPSKQQISEILDTYVPEQLPVLSGLARHYAISDQWFCSVPSQTNTNRAFYLAGTARGLVTNSFLEYHTNIAYWKPGEKKTHTDALPYGTRTLFDVLDENKVSWTYYWSSPWPPTKKSNQYVRTMFSMDGKQYDSHFKKFEDPRSHNDFVTNLAKGKLPRVSIIEPTWGGGGSWERPSTFSLPRGVGNEFHPVEDTMVGEFFIKRLYDLVSQSPAWEKTLLVITFDENGGTYDHFAPPPANGYADAVHQPSQVATINGLPKLPEKNGDADFLPGKKMLPEALKQLNHATYTQFGFEYDMFGIRVPTLFISPYIKPRTVLRSPTDVPFDHTSIITTILKWQAIDIDRAQLGERVANAPTFEGVLQGVGDTGTARPKNDPSLGIHSYGRQNKPQGALRYGDEIHLKYVGNPWSLSGPYKGDSYLAGPSNYLNYWYPYLVAKVTDPYIFKFKLEGGPGKNGKPVHNGASVEIVVSHSQQKPKAVGYKLAVPDKAPIKMAKSVWLTTQTGDHTHWRIWLLDDRVSGKELYPGDQVLLFSERYQPGKVSTGATGYDPYMRLTPQAPDKLTYLTFRAGEWDVWKIER